MKGSEPQMDTDAHGLSLGGWTEAAGATAVRGACPQGLFDVSDWVVGRLREAMTLLGAEIGDGTRTHMVAFLLW